MATSLPRGADLVDVARTVIKATHKHIHQQLDIDPERALQEISLVSRVKKLIGADYSAEGLASVELKRRLQGLGYDAYVVGEEGPVRKDLDLGAETRVVALVDMVDGTDLLIRGLENWCSAVLFFQFFENPPRVLAAAVGMVDGTIYSATHDRLGAFKWSPKSKSEVQVRVDPSPLGFADASLSFYGQKAKNYLAVAKCQSFVDRLTALKDAKTRIYNLAGNPMMMHMIDGLRRVDAVFDVCGQHPHDVIPGAFIARQAGAIFRTLKNEEIQLSQWLRKPWDDDSKMTYILASNKKLHLELTAAFASCKDAQDADKPA